jgi:hypothetical protein
MVWHLDARFRVAYLFEASSGFYVKPSTEVDVITVNMPAFNETGAGALNLHVSSMSQTFASLTPKVEIGSTLKAGDGGAVRPFMSGGITWYSSDAWVLTSRFEGTPTGVNPFITTTAFPETLYKFSAGIDYISSRKAYGLDVRLMYDGQFADGYRNHSGSVKASSSGQPLPDQLLALHLASEHPARRCKLHQVVLERNRADLIAADAARVR